MDGMNKGGIWKIAATILAFVSVGLIFYILGQKTQTSSLVTPPITTARSPLHNQSQSTATNNAGCREAAQNLRDIHHRWNESVRLASSTPRQSLSARIVDMQRIKQEIEAVTVPDCAKQAKKFLVLGAATRIDQFIDFLGGTSSQSSAKALMAIDEISEKALTREEAMVELAWLFQLELKGLEEGCDKACKEQLTNKRAQERELERARQKEAQKRSTIASALDYVKRELHNPSSAQFESLVWNPATRAVCGQLIAKNGRGILVREAFAVDTSNWSKTVGYDLRTGVNAGAIAAQRLCASGETISTGPANTISEPQNRPLLQGEMRGTIK